MNQSTAELAKSLIGVKAKPANFNIIRDQAREAEAYHRLQPYPLHAFRNWKVEDLGPLPRCKPIAKRIVRRSARFLFGRGVEIACPGNEALEKFLREAWEGNKMPSRMVALAERGAIDGNVVLKFAYDPDESPSLRIQTLSAIDQVRLFYHPHDRTQLIMARVQYRYFDPVAGAWYWHREEWTDEEEVHYKPVKEETMLGVVRTTKAEAGADPDGYDQWEQTSREANPFNVIPLVHIRNLETDDTWGTGDLWELYRQIDDLNLVWWQMKRSNQFDSELNPFFIDAELDDDTLDKPAQPGEPISVTSVDSGESNRQAKVVFPQGGNGLREAMMEYAKDLRREIEESAGATYIDQGEITNKGNLTQAVLTQMYAISIETIEEKRKSYGQNGIELFLEAAARGLANHKVADLGVNENPTTWDVQVKWPAHFNLTEEEKEAILARIQEAETAGYITRDRAVEMYAQVEGIRDIPKLLKELAAVPKPSPTEDDPGMVDPKEGKNDAN